MIQMTTIELSSSGAMVTPRVACGEIDTLAARGASNLSPASGQMTCDGRAPSVVGDVVPRGLGLQRPTRHEVGRKRHHKHAAGPCLQDNLITRASMLISALLYLQLGALRQQ